MTEGNESENFYQEEEWAYQEEELYDGSDQYEIIDADSLEFDIDDSQFSDDTNEIRTICNICKSFMPDVKIDMNSRYGNLTIVIPNSFLPLSMQWSYGFLEDKTAFTIEMELDMVSCWSSKPLNFNITHPVYGINFVGRILALERKKNFFKPDYKPKKFYRSTPFLLFGSVVVKKENIQNIMGKGFDESSARRALSVCNNNVDDALNLLRNGIFPSTNINVSERVSYKECPLLYLILEICDAFYDLPDHCCICGKKVTPGIRPGVCDAEICNFQYSTIGIGQNVTNEIKKDPLAADLLITMFGLSVSTVFCNPAPVSFKDKEILEILHNLPSCDSMAKYENDQKLIHDIGKRAGELLRWILLSCRSHFISLKSKLKMKAFKDTEQFMALVSSPEAESAFQFLKSKYGSFFLWHGSGSEKFHSIARNGLKNYSNTQFMSSGAAFGPGIYFARSSSTSWGYTHSRKNEYNNSALGSNVKIISLCEIAKLPINKTIDVDIPNGENSTKRYTGFLKEHGYAHTLTIEPACVVRFLMVSNSKNLIDFDVDVVSNPPSKIPTLSSVINYNINNIKSNH